MMAILAVGAVAVGGEVLVYGRARRSGKLRHYWWLLAAAVSVLSGVLLMSIVLPGDDWESRRVALVISGLLYGIIAFLRIRLTRRVDRPE